MSFAKNILKLASGSLLAQGFGVLVTPFLTRMYTPEDFGALALFISIMGVICPVACLGYEMAIVLPEKDEDAAGLVVISIFCAIGVSFIACFFFVYWVPSLPVLQFHTWVFSVFIFISGCYLTMDYWHTRLQNYSFLAKIKVGQSFCRQIPRLAFGWVGLANGSVLIITYIVGQVVVTVLLVAINSRLLFLNLRLTGIERLKNLFIRYKNFPLYNSWSTLINTASQQVTPLLLACFFNDSIVGYFALGRQMLGLPMAFIGCSVGQVFLQRATEGKKSGELTRIVDSVFKVMVSIGMFPFLFLAIIGESLFSAIFGSQWAEAGLYVQFLSLWLFFDFISNPISTLFTVLEKQKVSLFLNVFLFITRSLAVLLGGILGQPRLAVILCGLSGALGYLLWLVMLMKYANISVKVSMLFILKRLAFYIPFMVACFFIFLFFNNLYYRLFICGFLGVLFYAYENLIYIKETIFVLRDLPS